MFVAHKNLILLNLKLTNEKINNQLTYRKTKPHIHHHIYQKKLIIAGKKINQQYKIAKSTK